MLIINIIIIIQYLTDTLKKQGKGQKLISVKHMCFKYLISQT